MSIEVLEAHLSAVSDRLQRYEEAHAREHKMLGEIVISEKVSMEDRLEKLNELRQEVVKDRGLYLTRNEYEAKHDTLRGQVTALNDKIDALERTLNRNIDAIGETLDQKIGPILQWQNRAIGVATVGGLASVALGVILGHLWK